MRKPQTPETILKESAKQLLAYNRIINWPYPGTVLGVRGFPDRFGILHGGQFFALEFKIGKRQLTPEQENIKILIERAGGIYVVVRKLEDIIEGLGLPGRLF